MSLVDRAACLAVCNEIAEKALEDSDVADEGALEALDDESQSLAVYRVARAIAANIRTMPEPAIDVSVCCFCGKTRREVSALVAANVTPSVRGATICDECIAAAVPIAMAAMAERIAGRAPKRDASLDLVVLFIEHMGERVYIDGDGKTQPARSILSRRHAEIVARSWTASKIERASDDASARYIVRVGQRYLNAKGVLADTKPHPMSEHEAAHLLDVWINALVSVEVLAP